MKFEAANMKTSFSVSFALVAAVGLLAVGNTGCNKTSADAPPVNPKWVSTMRESKAAGGGAGGDAESGSGWGTLKGVFTFTGTPRTMGAIDTQKDPLCKVKIYYEQVRVNPSNKGLRDVLIYARKVPRVTPDYDPKVAKDAIFDQRDCRYLDHVFASSLKDNFTILNSDDTAHNSKGEPPGGNKTYNEQLAPKTGKFQYGLFKKAFANPYSVSCAIHPWMVGYHIVRPDPYFAVTNENGEFTIEKLPAGTKLEFQVWHERGAGENGGLQAKLVGDDKFVWKPEGRFFATVPENGELKMEIQVEESALLK